MNRFFRTSLLTAAVVGMLTFNSCDDELELPDNLVDFESTTLGFGSTENELNVNITLSREASADGTITVQATLTGVTYDTEFATEPASTNNTMTIAVPAGALNASFKVKKKDNVLLDGDESIKFTLASVDESLVLGEKKELTLTFAEIVAASATMDPNVGGAQQPNKVFVDFSANRQQSIARNGWDLGFATASNQFRVILNSSSAMMARALTKTDINAVTAADTAGFSVQVSTDAVFAGANSSPLPTWLNGSKAWIDDPAGDITKTAIAEISATESENKVYIINRGKNMDGTARGWKKVRILRNGTGYTVQHADIAATSFQTIQVTRDNAYAFNYISFNTGAVEVEPKKDKWDIAFSVFTNITPVDASTTIPYVFTDVVLQNTSGVTAVQILNSSGVTYDTFTEANIAGLTFNASQVAIGSSWRSGGGPGSAPAVRTDRFYVVKDANGNYYKLKFTAMSQNGERGRPKIEFVLVKKAS